MSYFIKKLESTYIKWIQTLPYQLISNTDHSIDYNIVHCPYFDFVGVWLLGGCDFVVFGDDQSCGDRIRSAGTFGSSHSSSS